MIFKITELIEQTEDFEKATVIFSETDQIHNTRSGFYGIV